MSDNNDTLNFIGGIIRNKEKALSESRITTAIDIEEFMCISELNKLHEEQLRRNHVSPLTDKTPSQIENESLWSKIRRKYGK